jgi:hypothetical protein
MYCVEGKPLKGGEEGYIVLRLPPRIKVLEALGAVVDGRVSLISENECRVKSSDGSRVYSVKVYLDKGLAYSDDNGTLHRGYVGYPIIAFLMVKGLIPINEEIGKGLRGIPWRRLNEEYRNYEEVMRLIIKRLEELGVDGDEVHAYVNEVMGILRRLKLERAP